MRIFSYSTTQIFSCRVKQLSGAFAQSVAIIMLAMSVLLSVHLCFLSEKRKSATLASRIFVKYRLWDWKYSLPVYSALVKTGQKLIGLILKTQPSKPVDDNI
jgi:hypothetical protein